MPNFPRLEYLSTAAEKAVAKAESDLSAAKRHSYKLVGQLEIWENLRTEKYGMPVSEMPMMSAGMATKLKAENLSSVGELLDFWLNATFLERSSLKGIGTPTCRKITQSIQSLFNRSSPGEFKNPLMAVDSPFRIDDDWRFS